MLKPKILKGPHFTAPELVLDPTESELRTIREEFIRRRPKNLEYLLRKRYHWMNEFIRPDFRVAEFGTGLGLTREFITVAELILTDVTKFEWVDKIADAVNPDFLPESLDAVICINVLHHLATPLTALKRILECVKPGGYILIRDAHPSLFLRTLMWLANNEGWSFEVDVFDENAIANDPNDPWSGNVAIPHLLFHDKAKLEQALPNASLILHEYTECLVFPLSGGVVQRTHLPSLPEFILKGVDVVDQVLIALLPNIFALGVSAVLKKHDP